MKKEKRYAAICGVCYSCVLGSYGSKKEANVRAASHMTSYHHNTWVSDNQEKKEDVCAS